MAHRDWLKALDADPAVFEAYVRARASPRLGAYFETLHAFWLAHGPSTALVAQNVPLRHEGRTEGELDFVYRRDGALTHLEVAVKFYLRVGSGLDLHNYVGPSLRDRFDKKAAKLLNAQSRRLEQATAQKVLRARGLDVRRAEVRLKGVLFEPLDERVLKATAGKPQARGERSRPAAISDLELAPGHLKGRWLPLRDLPAIERSGEWYVLDKLEWLSGPHGLGEPLTFEALAVRLARPGLRPVQVVVKHRGALHARYFVVPNDFLPRAQATLPPP